MCLDLIMIYFTADSVGVDVNKFSPVSIKRIINQYVY